MRIHERDACWCGARAVPGRVYCGTPACEVCNRLIPGPGDEIARDGSPPGGVTFGDGTLQITDRRWTSRIDPAAWEGLRGGSWP